MKRSASEPGLSDPLLLYEEKDPLAIEGPPDDDDDEIDTSYLQLEEQGEDDEFVDAEEGDDDDAEEGDAVEEANKILDELGLPNYYDVEMRLDEPEMTATKQRNYLQKVLNDADRTRRQAVVMKSNATRKFKKNQITTEEKNLINDRSDKLQKEIKDYMKYHQSKLYSIKGSGLKRGRGAYFFNDAKEMLQK